MTRHFVIVLKLADTVFRGMFLLFCTYRLGLSEAGRFGLTATLIAFICFVLGYESFNDLQRRAAGQAFGSVRGHLQDKLRFYLTHNLLIVPLAFLALVLALDWPLSVIVNVITIALAEHVSTQSYYAAVLHGRNTPLLVLLAIKNAALLSTTLAVYLLHRESFTYENILILWAATSALYIALSAGTWLVLPGLYNAKETHEPRERMAARSVPAQYAASWWHFLAGFLAIVALQVDKAVVGATLDGQDVGIYFRNVTLTGLLLQLFSIIYFTRASPRIFAMSREGNIAQSRAVANTEFRRFFMHSVAAFSTAWAINTALGDPAGRLGVNFLFLCALLVSVLLRAAADFKGVLLFSVGAARPVLRNQAIAIGVGVVILTSCALVFGLPGAIAASVVMPAVYLVLNRSSVNRWFVADPGIHPSQ